MCIRDRSFRLELIKNKRCTQKQFKKHLEKGWDIIAYESVMFCKMNRLAEKKFKKILDSDLTNDDFYVKLVENSFEYSPLLCLKKIEQELTWQNVFAHERLWVKTQQLGAK